MERNYNQEYQDNAERKYAYDFDYILRDYLLEDFKPWFHNNNALELGCYHGEFTKRLLTYFEKITVVEAASDLIAIAKNNLGEGLKQVNFINNTFEQSQLKARFDNIFLIHTLEHLVDPILVLKKIREWLTPMGKFFVAVPNAYALSRQIATAMELIPYCTDVTPGEKQHGHERTYAQDLLHHHLQLADFKIIQFGGTLVKPFSGAQFDQMLKHKIINEQYIEACYLLGKTYPQLAGSLYAVCQRE
jgi:2-polyprenyl-3-methyl-5-hydroxy-6-metoxy-1,4-benzoquinol methylase